MKAVTHVLPWSVSAYPGLARCVCQGDHTVQSKVSRETPGVEFLQPLFARYGSGVIRHTRHQGIGCIDHKIFPKRTGRWKSHLSQHIDGLLWLRISRGGWGGRGEGSSRGRGHMCTYDSSMLMCGRNQHNIVIILQLKINF